MRYRLEIHFKGSDEIVVCFIGTPDLEEFATDLNQNNLFIRDDEHNSFAYYINTDAISFTRIERTE